jgi:hypothetical protein
MPDVSTELRESSLALVAVIRVLAFPMLRRVVRKITGSGRRIIVVSFRFIERDR